MHNLKIDEWFEDICSGGLLLKQREQGMLMSTKLKKGDSVICSALDRYSRSHYGLVSDVEFYKKNKIEKLILFFFFIVPVWGTFLVASAASDLVQPF